MSKHKQHTLQEVQDIDADDQRKCDCIFCNSKCPECGSNDVSVMFKPSFTYDNDTDDFIDITYGEVEVELTYSDCGKSFFDDELENLITSLENSLDIDNYTFEWDGKGEPIKVERYTMVTRYN